MPAPPPESDPAIDRQTGTRGDSGSVIGRDASPRTALAPRGAAWYGRREASADDALPDGRRLHALTGAAAAHTCTVPGRPLGDAVKS
jgi:hypothetical protein